MNWLNSPLLTLISAAIMLIGANGAHNLGYDWLSLVFVFCAGFATMFAIVLWTER